MQEIQGDPRSLGVVYTPPEVTEPMVRKALEPMVVGRSAEEIAALRICDPAIGEGAFLLTVVRVLVEHLGHAGVADADARAQAARCVHGVDVDPRAVAAARTALGVDAELRVADALALDWADAFPAVFARGGFDAVIGNPPYVRQEHLAAHKPRLRQFASYDGVADLYVYFVELAHRLARPGGRYCLITPNKWLTAAYGRALRVHLAAQHSVEGVVDLGRSMLFAEADAFPCIVWGTVGADRDTPIRAARLPPGAAVELSTVGAPHARTRWRADPWHIDAPADRALLDHLEVRWPALEDVVPGAPARGVVTGCNRAFVLDRDTRDQLLAAEPAAAAVIRPFLKGRDVRCWLPAEAERWILLIDRGTSLAELPAVMAHLAQFRAVLEPRPRPGAGDPDGAEGLEGIERIEGLDRHDARAAAAGTGRKPGSYRWFELQDPVGPLIRTRAPRLLYQDIQTAPQCAIDLDGDVVPDTTVWMLPTDDRYLLAVLCSPLYGWYARRRFPPALNGAVRPKRAYIRRLPIATPSAEHRALIERLVAQRIALEQRRRAPASPAPEPREPPEPRGPLGDAAALDDAIARAVYDVYELSAADRLLLTAP